MKILLSSLKKFIKTQLTPQEIAEKLNLLGIEVENIINETPSFSSVVVGEIKAAKPHPNADHLTIAEVYDGNETVQVICGAPNCRENLKTAFAKIGAELTDENGDRWKIRKAKLRGIESYGMLCSGSELGLLEESEGIIELPNHFYPGEDLSQLSEPIFEISLTPNLGHCMSALGIARELAAEINMQTELPSFNLVESEHSIHEKTNVKIEDDRCYRYCARMIENIEIKPSPFWLKVKLKACGFRSINNIVDAINWTMLEYGQPMHAFDFDKIEKEIIIRKSKNNEILVTLDEEQREIPEEAILITDRKKILAVAGIMGGKSSEISETTTNILIESACFDPITVRKTSNKMNLRSESSIRFEKGIDFDRVSLYLDYACDLITEISKGSVLKEKIDKKTIVPDKKSIYFSSKRANDLLGIQLSLNEMEEIFHRLECSTKTEKENDLFVTPPSYRNDLNHPIDLTEEIARIYGFHNIDKKPSKIQPSKLKNAPYHTLSNQMKRILISQGLQEWISADLISYETASHFANEDDLVQVLHSKSKETSILRPSLLPGFLEIIHHNQVHKNFHLKAFEIANVHFKKKDQIIEHPVLSMAITGNRRPHHWEEKPNPIDFYDLKGLIENFSTSLCIDLTFQSSEHPLFHPAQQLSLQIDKNEVGIMGRLHPRLLKEFDIEGPVYFSEIFLSQLIKAEKRPKIYQPISPFPETLRDLTLTIDKDFPYKTIHNTIKDIKAPLLKEVILLDVYEDPSLQEKRKITLRFIYQDKIKTITFEEAEKEHDKIVKSLTAELKDHIFA